MLFLIALFLFVALAELLPRQANTTPGLRAVVAFSYLGFIWLMIFLAIAKLLVVALISTGRLFSNS